MLHVYRLVGRVEGVPELVEADNYVIEDGKFKFIQSDKTVLLEIPVSDVASVSSSPKL